MITGWWLREILDGLPRFPSCVGIREEVIWEPAL
jgi:hypothetical protein